MTDEKGETCNVSLLNVKSEEQARVSSGRLFHARAAATRKARSPRVARRVDGTNSVSGVRIERIGVRGLSASASIGSAD